MDECPRRADSQCEGFDARTRLRAGKETEVVQYKPETYDVQPGWAVTRSREISVTTRR